MNDRMTVFAAVWTRLWSGDVEDAGPGEVMRDPLELRESPPYPLARTVEMPPGHGYETGALSFRLTDLALHGVSRLDPERCVFQEEGDRIHLELAFPELALRGRYLVEAKPDPIVDLDTAGDLMDLPATNGRDAEKEAWLGQAKDEEKQLEGNPNGQRLLRVFREHNEAYNTVFQTNEALVTNWKADGATREMAADTSKALRDGGVINDPEKTYTGDVTYNGNAFAQQVNVASACLAAAKVEDKKGNKAAADRYRAAAKAAMSFAEEIAETTGNSEDKIEEMTRSGVYAAVDQHDGSVAQVSDEKVDLLQQWIEGSFETDSEGGGDAELDLDWMVVRQEARPRLRSIHEAAMKQGREETFTSLFEGFYNAHVDRVDVDLILEEGPDGRTPRAASARIALPSLASSLGFPEWSGAAGEVARQRIERLDFVHGLLHQAVQQPLLAAAEHACRALLRGA